MVSGHSHIFNLFNRSNVFFILPAPTGGHDELFYSLRFTGPRYFTGFKTGPLEPVDEYSDGFEYHVESFVWDGMRIKTYVDIEETKLVYTVVDLSSGDVVRSYE